MSPLRTLASMGAAFAIAATPLPAAARATQDAALTRPDHMEALPAPLGAPAASRSETFFVATCGYDPESARPVQMVRMIDLSLDMQASPAGLYDAKTVDGYVKSFRDVASYHLWNAADYSIRRQNDLALADGFFRGSIQYMQAEFARVRDLHFSTDISPALYRPVTPDCSLPEGYNRQRFESERKTGVSMNGPIQP